MTKTRSQLELEQENYVKYKWLGNKLKNVKHLAGIDCIDCKNHVQVKEQFYDEQMFGLPFWMETDSYCRLGLVAECPRCKQCKGYDYGKPKIKYVKLKINLKTNHCLTCSPAKPKKNCAFKNHCDCKGNGFNPRKGEKRK